MRTIAFAYLFAVYSYVQPVGYRHAYPTISDRLAFAHSFADNVGLRLFYGEPRSVATISGYTAWRVGGTLAIVAAAFGLLAAVRALRTEEDVGRMELVLAGAVGRRAASLSAMGAIAAGIAILWLAEFAGFALGGLPAGGSAYLALATASVVPVFVVSAPLVSQLAPTRRIALELEGAIVALCWLLRVIADTAGNAGWLRWGSPARLGGRAAPVHRDPPGRPRAAAGGLGGAARDLRTDRRWTRRRHRSVPGARYRRADEQLETLFAQPVSRARWFGGRLLPQVARCRRSRSWPERSHGRVPPPSASTSRSGRCSRRG